MRLGLPGDMKSVWKQLLYSLLFLICTGMCLMCYMVRNYSCQNTHVIREREEDYPYIGNTTSQEKEQLHKDYPYNGNTTTQEKELMLKPDLYVFSLSYMDQISWASTRWRSLQCWASQLRQRYGIHVVEPFVTDGTHLGVPTPVNQNPHEVLKFSDIFDISLWQRSVSNGSFPVNIVSWEAFLSSGARNVVAIQIVYPYHYYCTENRKTDNVCSNVRMQRLFSQHLAPNNFTLLKSICINFRDLDDILTIEQFSELILDNIPESFPITVMFDEWRGLGENSCIARVSGGNCSVYNKSFIGVTLDLMTPSSRIKSAAQKYIDRYLHRQKVYAAIMIRWEKILLYDFYSYHNASQHYSGSRCLKGIRKYVKDIFKKRHIKVSFLTTDIGKYGSSTFDLYNSTRVSTSILTDYTEKLLRILYWKSLHLSKYEQRFEEVSGSENPAFISQLQKAIAARARCLLLVGWGSFHRNTLDMYKANHKGQKLCYKVVNTC